MGASVKYVPEWFPGARFQKRARLLRKVALEMNDAPFEAVKQALVSSMVVTVVLMLINSRILGSQSLLSLRRYWKKSKVMRRLGKRISYEPLDPPRGGSRYGTCSVVFSVSLISRQMRPDAGSTPYFLFGYASFP
jgi:hypothetical protein